MSHSNENFICIVCSDEHEEGESLDSLRSLLGLSASQSELTLSTRYYFASVGIRVLGLRCNCRSKICEVCERSSDNTGSLKASLKACGAVILFANDSLSGLVEAQRTWSRISAEVQDNCIRLLLLQGPVDTQIALGKILTWSVEAGIEVLCEEVCEGGLSVPGRLMDALQCAEWPSRKLTALGSEVSRSNHVVAMPHKSVTGDGKIILEGNRVRKPLLGEDVESITQTLLQFDVPSSDSESESN